MSLSSISNSSVGKERSPLSVSSPSGKKVNQVDTRAIAPPKNSPGTSLPSSDVGIGSSTVRLEYNMFGHARTASAGGNNAQIPAEVHSLGIDLKA